MRWSVFFYLSSKRNRKFKHLVQTKPMGENPITHIMKVSVAGTSLKESEKKVYESLCKKTTVRKLKKAEVVSSEHITNVTGLRGINFLNLNTMKSTKKRYDDACSRPNEIMKTPALLKSKYYINIGSFRHHNNCGSTHPSMAASECFKDHKVHSPYGLVHFC